MAVARWAVLYGTIWLITLEIWLAFTPVAPPVPYYVHIALGFALIAIAATNYVGLRSTTVPARIKRVARATAYLTVLMAALGAVLAFGWGGSGPTILGIAPAGVVRFLHLLNALAILGQACAVAMAYDMWEEREFERPTVPGEVPPNSEALGGRGRASPS